MDSPAPAAQGGQRLNLDRASSKFSKKSKQNNTLSGRNSLKTLQSIADKWVDKGYHRTPGRALQPLIGGDL